MSVSFSGLSTVFGKTVLKYNKRKKNSRRVEGLFLHKKKGEKSKLNYILTYNQFFLFYIFFYPIVSNLHTIQIKYTIQEITIRAF